MTASRHGEMSAFERIGGKDGLRRLASRFYAIMSEQPAASGIRAMHKPDLGPISDSLAEFLMGWIGGPRDWFLRGDRPCIMSLHRALPIGASERDQWLACMDQALAETVSDAELRAELGPALARMADAMRSS
ncbi:MAG: group II truncated hemoglobin [Hyphomonadaceae bacterium]